METWYRADLNLIEIKEFLIKKETASKVIEHDGVVWPKVSLYYVFAKTKEEAKKYLIEHITHTYERMRQKAEKL